MTFVPDATGGLSPPLLSRDSERSSSSRSRSAAEKASPRRGPSRSARRSGQSSFSSPSLRSRAARDSGLRYGVVLADLGDYVQSFDHLPKNGVDSVQVLGVLLTEHDEELTPARVLSGVRHRQRANLVLARIPLRFAVDLVARTARSNRTLRVLTALRIGIAALDHEILDDTMELRSIIEAGVGELLEVGDRLRRLLLVELGLHRAFVGFNRSES